MSATEPVGRASDSRLRFVDATGYVTGAEIVPDLQDHPGALPHMLQRDVGFRCVVRQMATSP